MEGWPRELREQVDPLIIQEPIKEVISKLFYELHEKTEKMGFEEFVSLSSPFDFGFLLNVSPAFSFNYFLLFLFFSSFSSFLFSFFIFSSFQI